MPFIFFAALLLSFSAKADIVHWQADCRQRLPYIYWENGTCSGPGADMLELVISMLGPQHRIIWRLVPWARTMQSAEEGSVDLVPVHSCFAERDQVLKSFVFGYEIRTIAYFKHREDERDFFSFDDIKKLQIGALRGSYYSEQFNNALDDMTVYTVTDVGQLIEMLRLKRIDIAISSQIHGLELFQQHESLIPATYQESYKNYRCFSIPRKSARMAFFPKIDEIIQVLKDRGEVTEIYARYGLLLEQDSD